MIHLLNLKYRNRPVTTLVKDDGEPWWVNNEVCAILGHGNPRQTVATHLDDDEKDDVQIMDAIGRPQRTLIINESGLYALIFGSKVPEARRFRKWVTKD